MRKKTFFQKYRELKKHEMLREKELFQNNIADVQKINAKVLRGLMFIALPLMIVLVFSSLCLDSIQKLNKAYTFLLIVSVIIAIAFYVWKSENAAILGLYGYFLVVAGFSIYVSVFQYPTEDAVSFLGILCLAPLIVLDRTWRINTIMLGVYLIHQILAFLYKPMVIAQEDMVNLTCFLFTSLFIGNRVRMTHLQNFEIKRQAHIGEDTDFLTQLPNKRKLFQSMRRSEKASDGKIITGVMMIDIDKFKLYNDSYGHQMGDDCLAEVATCFRRFGEENEIFFYRYGGEEFIALSYRHNYRELTRLGEKLNKAVRNLGIENKATSYGVVTVSVGVAKARDNTRKGHESMIKEADCALYMAKETGRNKTMCYMGKEK